MRAKKVNILLVDDREENLLTLKAVLASRDYNFITAKSGPEALKKILKYDFAVILLDIQMPGMDGFETARIIKTREKSKDIPIIFITANNQSLENVLEGYNVGAVDYLLKPFNPQTLKMKIHQFVKLYQSQDKKQKELQGLLETNSRSLKLYEERFYKIFRSSPCLLSIRSINDKKYIEVNESWLKFSGFSAKDILNKTTNILKLSLEGMQQDDFERLLDLEADFYNEKVTYYTKDGSLRHGLLSTELLEIENEPCILAVITDISETVKFETEFRRLERLNLIGEMAAGIAHEIRNPLTTVRGFLQMAEYSDAALTKEYISLMIEELDRANGIISEYLTLAKNKRSERKMTDINKIIESLLPLLQAEAFLTDKEIIVDLAPCPALLLDEKEIRQLILNLSLNGLEAMAPGKRLYINTYVDKKAVLLEVVDQGSGIQKADLAKLGTPFFTTKEGGTGLGLAVCYSIAERHQAKIDMKTSKKGTSFSVRFNS